MHAYIHLSRILLLNSFKFHTIIPCVCIYTLACIEFPASITDTFVFHLKFSLNAQTHCTVIA